MKFGGYVYRINIHQHDVIPLPTTWSFEEGAGLLVQGLTAFYALTAVGNLQKGQPCLSIALQVVWALWPTAFVKNGRHRLSAQ